jgi:hypothetical protein
MGSWKFDIVYFYWAKHLIRPPPGRRNPGFRGPPRPRRRRGRAGRAKNLFNHHQKPRRRKKTAGRRVLVKNELSENWWRRPGLPPRPMWCLRNSAGAAAAAAGLWFFRQFRPKNHSIRPHPPARRAALAGPPASPVRLARRAAGSATSPLRPQLPSAGGAMLTTMHRIYMFDKYVFICLFI